LFIDRQGYQYTHSLEPLAVGI